MKVDLGLEHAAACLKLESACICMGRRLALGASCTVSNVAVFGTLGGGNWREERKVLYGNRLTKIDW